MEQGIQSNFPHDALKAEGCYFFCLLRWAELLGIPPFDTAKKIIDLFDKCVEAGWAESDCFIVNPVKIVNLAMHKTVFHTVYKKDPPMPMYAKYGLMYLKKPGHNHFVLAEDNRKIWDSLDPNRPGVSDYKLDSYRILS